MAKVPIIMLMEENMSAIGVMMTKQVKVFLLDRTVPDTKVTLRTIQNKEKELIIMPMAEYT
jgi:hypothetical protein